MLRIKLAGGVLAAALLVACGGGGGGGSSAGPGGGGVPPTSAPTAAPAPVTGTVVDYASSAPLSGFTVTIGALPPMTCSGFAGCGSPLAPTYTATTAADGSFAISGVPVGTMMLQIGKDATYATLHASISTATRAIGQWKLVALPALEIAEAAQLNSDRVLLGLPASPGNLVVDNYAELAMRQWATDVASGKTPYTDAAFMPYGAIYASMPGALYRGGAAVLSLTTGWSISEAQWMGEKANCPNGNWQTCTFAPNTGHYMNIMSTNNVWIGMGSSATSPPGFSGFFPYGVMLVQP